MTLREGFLIYALSAALLSHGCGNNSCTEAAAWTAELNGSYAGQLPGTINGPCRFTCEVADAQSDPSDVAFVGTSWCQNGAADTIGCGPQQCSVSKFAQVPAGSGVASVPQDYCYDAYDPQLTFGEQDDCAKSFAESNPGKYYYVTSGGVAVGENWKAQPASMNYGNTGTPPLYTPDGADHGFILWGGVLHKTPTNQGQVTPQLTSPTTPNGPANWPDDPALAADGCPTGLLACHVTAPHGIDGNGGVQIIDHSPPERS